VKWILTVSVVCVGEVDTFVFWQQLAVCITAVHCYKAPATVISKTVLNVVVCRGTRTSK
jgi:hypothetical protein